MLFWIVSLGVATLAGLALARAALKGGAAAPEPNADVKVYRDQLAEIDRDLARGVIGTTEAERTRIEVSRRLLEADRTGMADAAGTGGRPLVPLLLVGLAIAGAFGVYTVTGVPGYPDLPIAKRIARAEELREDRPSQAAAEAEAVHPARPAPDPQFAELMDRLRKAVADRPDDLRGQQLLARNEAALGNFVDAARAQAQVVALMGENAGANDYAELADNYVLAAGGYVSPEAETALARALKLDPGNGTARFYMGLMWAQTGRPDLAFRFWRALLEEGPDEAPWIPMIRSQIGLLAEAAGVDYTPPAPPGAAAPGPDAGQVAAAADMTDAERQEMIRGMVDRLSERLGSEGGSPEEWARLISALGVLGEADRAKTAYGDARTALAGNAAGLATIRAAAEQAGVAE